MSRCLVGHAMHPDWRAALALAAAQLDGQAARADAAAPTLGLVYFSDHYAAEADALYAALRQRWPGVAWAGTVGVGVCAGGVEYFDEPALVLMLCPLPATQFRVFSGARPLAAATAAAAPPASALVHADANTHDLPELLADLGARTATGYLFGGLGSSRGRSVQIADGVFEGGLSGVAFAPELGCLSRVTQGCQPVGPTRTITACDRNVVTELDGQPALQCLLADLDLSLDEPRRAMATLRSTLVGLAAPRAPLPLHADGSTSAARPRHRAFGDDVRVRHLIGLDPARHGVAVADRVDTGMTLAFCQRDVAAARRDLVRICAEIRDELAPEPVLAATASGADDLPGANPSERIAGAVYVSCAGRGGPHFGGPSAELQIVRHALGDVPLVGFFAAGEIGHQQLYGYTGVLTVFTRDA